MDFYKIKEREAKNKGTIEIYPDFKVVRSKDLMIRGRSFYAIWDEKRCLWSTDEFDVQRLVDQELWQHRDEVVARNEGIVSVKLMGDFSSGSWLQFRNYMKNLSDNSHQLDESFTFANTETSRTDYVSRRLSYPLAKGDISAWDEIVGTLYDEEEREKIEWAIGAVLSGEAKYIQKFLVFYGPGGTGKSTIMNIIMMLTKGYYTTFEAKALVGNSNAFATEVFKDNPLVAIQHDGDLSKIEDNTKLNSIISHEEMQMNEKFKPSYMARINAFLFMGTNKPVKITDAKSGIIRRLIDVQPTGNKLPPRKYQALMTQIPFELGAIAWHCIETFRDMGRDYYEQYRPIEMMLQTDVFFNFIEAYFDVFSTQNGVTLNAAYDMYKQFCEETNVDYKLPRYRFREELKNYFSKFEERAIVDDVRVRSWYSEFETKQFTSVSKKDAVGQLSPLILDKSESIFDTEMANYPAQYAKEDGTPKTYWDKVTTTLANLDTSQVHYVKVPENHIVIDFDLKDENGNKSAERNIEAAAKWPHTYAEFSKGGAGVHLHYIYDGDVSQLKSIYAEDIEVKVFTGNSSLRRKRSACNGLPFTTINSGLPLKEKKMINQDTIKSEKALRDLINRNLKKEIHPGTKPSIDFIHKILEEAYDSGLTYDVTDMQGRILTFATMSTNQALPSIKKVQDMKFASAERSSEIVDETPDTFKAAQAIDKDQDDRIVFYDVEVFPNLFMINWKYQGSDVVTRMINPSPQAVEGLMKLKLVGFNCRRYDNHILYARYMGYNNEQLYKLSKKIIDGAPHALFGEAYNISYADIYDFSSKKMGLKKFQLELGIHHKELGLPWDEPVPEDMWELVAEYCDNDVISTEKVFEDRYQDYVARLVLADLSGLPVNSTTQQHTGRIIFGSDKKPQSKFVYTDLSEMFPGYKFEYDDKKKSMLSTYRGEEVGEGGYVYSEPGMYENVVELDVASMHPTSIEELNLFGDEFTKNFSALKKARIAIKRGDYETARKMLNGALVPYLHNVDDAEALSYALKIVINIVYGLTSAKFENLFRDPRNKDNIVAKRGALFMIDLKNAVQERGFQVVHIKTDSIKIPNATKEIIEFVMDFGQNYGYEFEHDATYEKFCLVNDAVYIAKTAPGKKPSHWTATGAQFQHPYVFKTLFSKEPVEFNDMCETKTVQTALYLDFDTEKDKEAVEKDIPMVFDENEPPVKNDKLKFVGKAGSFTPIKEGRGGGFLMREKDGKFYAATGTKGHFWLEAEVVRELDKIDDIDLSYFDKLCKDAIKNISNYGDFEEFAA